MDSCEKTCAVVAACDFNVAHFKSAVEKQLYGCIVAVDGGLAHLQKVGCKADCILGDFDSLGYVPKGPNVICYPAHKDKSDLELALDLVYSEGLKEAYVYGALGGRLDHTMAAVHTCARFAESGLGITMVSLQGCMRILVGPATYELPMLDAGVVSVFSATDQSEGVSEWGMEYPLENAVLTNRTTLGLSNELNGRPAGIKVNRGTLYVFHP